MRNAGLPITLIIVGTVWLVWHFHLIPDKDWVIGSALIAGGIAVLALDRITKSSVVNGPFLIAVGGSWLARDIYGFKLSVIMPSLLILLGVLMLIARLPSIPERRTQPTRELQP